MGKRHSPRSVKSQRTSKQKVVSSVKKGGEHSPVRPSKHGRQDPYQSHGRSTHTKSVLVPKVLDPIEDLLAVNPEGIEIIYEDQDLIIVNKPAGWLTHPDGQSTRSDLSTALSESRNIRLSIHQRLDVSTSGLICFGKSVKGGQFIEKAVQEGEKCYLAVVEGQPPHQSGFIDQPVPMQPTKSAKTRYEVIDYGPSWSVLHVWPMTGRTHQIRAHLSSIGCPIRGDNRYGDPFEPLAPRALLHSYQLTILGQRWTAEPPPEFARYYKEPHDSLRRWLYRPNENESYRWHHGIGDGTEGWRVDRYGDWAWIIHDEGSVEGPWPTWARNAFKITAKVDRSKGVQSHPQLIYGTAPIEPINIFEAGVRYQVELGKQLSTGLF